MIGADLVPTGTNHQLFANGDTDTLIGEELKEIFINSNYRIFNLEVPLTDYDTPIRKHGPNLRAATDTICGIKELNPSLFTLANNHIMDQNEQGLISTCKLLNEYHIGIVGAGKDSMEAAQPYILYKEGIRIGIYACADHEFSIATKERMGANPFDPLESLDQIQRLKSMCNYVIVLYHGGKENYRYPSPYLQKVCQRMAEKGADYVICQHSHCIGCYEPYKGSTIVYGQGNFLFDDSDQELWETGLLILLTLERRQSRIQYIPIVKKGNTVRMASGTKRDEILASFLKRSAEIGKPGFIEEEYNKLAKQTVDVYLKAFRSGNYLYRIINKISRNRLSRRYSVKQLLAIENYIACDAHRELLLNGIKNREKKRDYD